MVSNLVSYVLGIGTGLFIAMVIYVLKHDDG